MTGVLGIPRGWRPARRVVTPSGAVVAELPPETNAHALFAAFAGAPRRLFLDSALVDAPSAGPSTAPRLGRFSSLAVDPILAIDVAAGEGAAERVALALARLRGILGDLPCQPIPGLPPFQGGFAGLFAYEAGLTLVDVAAPPGPGAPVPLVSLGLYDVVFTFDHDARRAWIVSQGVPARGPVARASRAQERLDAVLDLVGRPAAAAQTAPPRLPSGPAVPLAGHPGVHSTHSPEHYRAMVAAGIEFVRAGDVFQVNLAQRLAVAGETDPTTLHLRARDVNPAPFAASYDCGTARITSMSPERLLSVTRGFARMHPIKGTRRVLALPEADLYAGDDLGSSDKDRAENVMIVDLVRNDLARVCTPGSVRVEALCRLERYATVQHLVSIVTGRLAAGRTALDALLSAIPGGSVTGAPKRRACEIVSALEPVPRGAYCGSIGWLGLDGDADFNLLIRTFVAADGATTFAAGGGITAASDPAAEHAESLHKAEGMLRVLASLGSAAAAARPGDPP